MTEPDPFAALMNAEPEPVDLAAKLAEGAPDRLNGQILWDNHEDTHLPRMVVNGRVVVA